MFWPDMGYTNKSVNDFVFPARELGYDLTIDLPANTPTRQAFNGGVIVDGDLWCPCTPHLNLTDRVPRNRPPAERQVLHDKYDERANYRFTRRATSDLGEPRMECPARAGRVRCRLIPVSMRAGHNKPLVPNPPARPELVCTAVTVQVSYEKLGRFHQRRPYGTTRHAKSLARRTSVERGNASLKTLHGTLQRGSIRCYGLENMLLLGGLYVAAVNVHITEAFKRNTSERAQRKARRHAAGRSGSH